MSSPSVTLDSKLLINTSSIDTVKRKGRDNIVGHKDGKKKRAVVSNNKSNNIGESKKLKKKAKTKAVVSREESSQDDKHGKTKKNANNKTDNGDNHSDNSIEIFRLKAIKKKNGEIKFFIISK